ncbi:ATP-binding cassette domain-containing protein [Streptomyces rhizosphaerihabitans]|uniref:ATP-binding cassette domain-containing protein n=1 Tax=Streptomyces rhizosphaerihabitans TaxID=1266770 RepID=UPI0021C05D4C|nr:ATP-binding cassette domain-containing protein [Streptomyces rhizosphaerihabitans]MCT9008006.1 ATP-binding cassette domain-containing protein [Streptomyces rhizosphaerihabitans]
MTVYRRGLRLLRAHRRAVAALAAWSVVEAGQAFLMGYALARALDAGFLAGRARTGLGWLGAGALAVVVGAYGTRRVYGGVAALVEPVRDQLVRHVVARGVREGDGGALSGLTQQVEIARDTFAGLVMVSRSFLFTAAGALIGLCSLDPLLLLVVAPPLAAGLALFVLTLPPLARRQEAFLVADEEIADHLGRICPGLRDIMAAGAEARVTTGAGVRIAVELRAARSLARWGVLRVVCLAVGGQLPLVLLLATAPWLLAHGVTPGALVGALAYVTQSLLPALQNLVHGLGTSGSRLAVVLRRLTPDPPPTASGRDGALRTAVPPTDSTRAPQTTAPPNGSTGARGTAVPPTGDGPRPSAPLSHPLGTPASSGHAPDAGPALSVTALTFAYGPGGVPVIENLHLRVPRGAHLAVVGPSGIGKSTLMGLVAGLLEPTSGTIQVNGQPVHGRAAREEPAWIQPLRGPTACEQRVLIPQEAYVFTGTLAENLGQLRPGPVPEAELRAAAEAVGLDGLMERLGGPAAAVDPRTLSAGERQLIALTRAYLSYAPLALLDEATCHLDPEAEERAERAFAARPGGTVVVVAHRISSARRAARVLVMDGRRAVLGDHEELVERSPLYRDLTGSWSHALTASPRPARSGSRRCGYGPRSCA